MYDIVRITDTIRIGALSGPVARRVMSGSSGLGGESRQRSTGDVSQRPQHSDFSLDLTKLREQHRQLVGQRHKQAKQKTSLPLACGSTRHPAGPTHRLPRSLSLSQDLICAAAAVKASKQLAGYLLACCETLSQKTCQCCEKVS